MKKGSQLMEFFWFGLQNFFCLAEILPFTETLFANSVNSFGMCSFAFLNHLKKMKSAQEIQSSYQAESGVDGGIAQNFVKMIFLNNKISISPAKALLFIPMPLGWILVRWGIISMN